MPFPPELPRLPDRPTEALPLRGVTVLVVEDSRFACDALRLILARSGARLRRAETLAGGRLHLAHHRPDLAIIDLGLPDGRGELLIAEAGALGLPVLACSGDPDARAQALEAGAVAFVDKPLPSAAGLVRLIRQLVTGLGPVAVSAGFAPASGDPLALRDDLERAAALVAGGGLTDPAYAKGFVRSLARAAGDPALERAALAAGDEPGKRALVQLLQQRLQAAQPVA